MEKHKLYDIMVAFANGKTVQVKVKNVWENVDYPAFNTLWEYRIKPEIIPFDFTDAEKIIGKIVRHKEGLNCVAVLVECNLQHICIGNDFEIYEVLLQDYTFLDDSPCGKLKE